MMHGRIIIVLICQSTVPCQLVGRNSRKVHIHGSIICLILACIQTVERTLGLWNNQQIVGDCLLPRTTLPFTPQNTVRFFNTLGLGRVEKPPLSYVYKHRKILLASKYNNSTVQCFRNSRPSELPKKILPNTHKFYIQQREANFSEKIFYAF